jgi:hypothetical protein
MQNVPPAAVVRIDPGAAAASLTERTGRPLEPDAAFAVYRLGRAAFQAAVVRRVGHSHVIVAERTAAIGGAEFDGLLLAYLSGRHPDAGVRLWSRVDDPSEPADWKLRALLLEKIAKAREDLSANDFTVFTLKTADVKLPLTREELESRIEELIESTADLMEEALGEAGVAPDAFAGVVMAGGASRTPLVTATLRRRFGVEPVAAAPGAVEAVEAPPAETRELPTVDEEPARRGRVRAVAVVAALAVVVAAGAAFGSQLGGGDPPEGGAGAAESAPAATGDREATSVTPSPSADGTASGESATPSESPSPDPVEETPAGPTREETSEEEEARPTTERAPTGTVPNLVGLLTADARKAVDEAGFADLEQTGEQRGVFDFSYDDCEVIEQSPEAGTTRPLAETVKVTFSYASDASEC